MKHNSRIFHQESKDSHQRKWWMGVLARSSAGELEHVFDRFSHMASYRFLRAPEVGMAMVRGRANGKGRPFNLGEMTMTRCSVRLENISENGGGEVHRIGHGYVAGRSKRHAELAAFFDAMLQLPEYMDMLIEGVITPLERAQQEKRAQQAEKTASTKVDFFTMVRGED